MEILILVVYILALFILFVYGMHSLTMLYLYARIQRVDPPMPTAPNESDLPMVTVQLPLYNEFYVSERLVESVCSLDWPRHLLEIQVLDDSTDETSALMRDVCRRKLAEGFMISYIHRDDRSGFKAGALSAGTTVAQGEYIAIFDADFLPAVDFLRKSIPHLVADATLGLVQGRWEHLNIDYSLLTRIQAIALDAHFVMEQQVRNRSKFFMNFNGTAGVWRRSCILDAGDWQSDTLTEDLDLSYRAQLRGWRFLYLNDLAVPAELPSEINGLKTQQYRWTKGAIETAKKHLPAIWRSKLSLEVKLHATAHLTSNLVFPCILVVALLNVPILLVKQSQPDLAIYFQLMSLCVIASIASVLFYMNAQMAIRADWRERIFLIPFSLAGMMGMAVNNTRGVIGAIFNHRTPFVRTPKYNIRSTGDNWSGSRYGFTRIRPDVIIEILLAAYFVVALVTSIRLRELSLIPFQLMFLFGFTLTGFLSLRHSWVGRGSGPVRNTMTR